MPIALNFDRRHFENSARLIARCNREFKGQSHYSPKIRDLLPRGRFGGVRVTDSELATTESFTPSITEFW